MTRHVAGLWRYPGEIAGRANPLRAALLTSEGIPGDRIVQLRGPEGVRTSRRHHRLLGLQGTLDPNGIPCINGHPWDSPEALALIRKRRGRLMRGSRRTQVSNGSTFCRYSSRLTEPLRRSAGTSGD